MEKFTHILSSGSKTKNAVQYTLQNLSPQKYGKAAFSNLTYTPSKLADNVLFNVVSNQKKIQEGTSKLRQKQAYNSIITDRLSELQLQKQGIEKTLGQQITMYKKMLKEKQQKNQRRIVAMQQSFNHEIKVILDQKQQQATFAQAEKQILQKRIDQLEQQLNECKQQLEDFNFNHDNIKNEFQKLKLQYKDLSIKQQQTQNTSNQLQEKYKQQLQTLKRRMYENQIQWQNKLTKQLQAKDKQIQNLQRLQRNQLQKIQGKRIQQSLIKNQELKDLATTFQKQTTRLNGIINKKQDQISQMNKSMQNQKQKGFTASKNYQNQITSLTHEKTRLKQELIKAQRKLQKLTTQHEQITQKYHSIKGDNQAQTAQLKKDLQMNQLHYMGQMDKLQFALNESTKQIVRLKLQNQQVLVFQQENSILNRQIKTMKQLLLQSSDQMERCKQEFLKICRQKDILMIKLRQIGLQNQTLYMIKNSKQQEARGWKQSYLINRSKY